MKAMSEAEVYERITKNGKDTNSIRKATEMLRQHFSDEYERTVHVLKTYDPTNAERHEAEVRRQYEEANHVLDRVLMAIAQDSPRERPILAEKVSAISEKAAIPKAQAKAWISLPFILALAALSAVVYGSIASFGLAIILTILFALLRSTGLDWSLDFMIVWWGTVIVMYLCFVIHSFTEIRRGESALSIVGNLVFAPLKEVFEFIGKAGEGMSKR